MVLNVRGEDTPSAVQKPSRPVRKLARPSTSDHWQPSLYVPFGGSVPVGGSQPIEGVNESWKAVHAGSALAGGIGSHPMEHARDLF